MFKKLLNFFGWNVFEKESLQNFTSKNKGVIVYPHTSYWDFPIFLLYRLAYPELSNVKVLMSERFSWMFPFKFIQSVPDLYLRTIQRNISCGFILSLIFYYLSSCIKTESFTFKLYKNLEETNMIRHNTLDNLVEDLSKQNKFFILISPKGSTQKKKWRSGYYYLAKYLNCPLLVGGLDYKERRLIFKEDEIMTDEEIEMVEIKLKEKMKSIIQKYPEKED